MIATEKQTASTATDVFGAALSRRGFVKAGGTLMVGFTLLKAEETQQAGAAGSGHTLNPALPESWIEIHADNSVLIRVGKPDFGQGTVFTAYRQIAAEELRVPFEAITTVISGDTDRTPDGSGAFDFLQGGMPNIRKAGAYVYQALLDLASEHLGVPKDQLSVKDGVVSGGGKSVSYGDLVKNQKLNLTIPVKGDVNSMSGLTVEGNPPLKPVSEYSVVGKSFPNSVTVSKVTAKETWVTDLRLPGMLHARMVHPKTLGSQLESVGPLDKARFPNTQVIVKGNLVGVVAPTEWEAIKAAQQVASGTKWTDWKGLPGDQRLFQFLKEDADWKTAPAATSKTSKGNVASAIASSPKRFSASYQLPFLKHAPIGPTMAVADVRSDGSVYVHTHTQNPQALRTGIAQMLNTSVDHVVVRNFSGPGHYGRSNGGNAGAEDEAVILSQAVGKPVRVQWMRPDDFQWSTQSSAAYSDVQLGLDAEGKLTGYQIDHYMPAMQDDRLVGAVLAGLPTIPSPGDKGSAFGIANAMHDPWIYDGAPAVLERAYGTFQVGQKSSPLAVGLRDHSMRTPGQYQQNFPRELAITEAALLAGVDPLQFRIQHARDKRAIAVLESVREASAWRTRSERSENSRGLRQGQGVAAMFRSGTYWACVAHIAVDMNSGVIKVENMTVSVDPGIVVNPSQLKRQIEGGSVMGVSMALLEELRFDESAVLASDWRSYPIATMADLPEIKVVLINRPEVGKYGQGSEAANALAGPAIAGALLDATGKVARWLPLKPAYVQALLKA
ncbi:MAG TPA: molybdopterin cofactor-binding domain-containing protein [Bryobacteraceae bacterium]|jgi:CO/xanthine dehydrogenase Mo-binding subunit|nr:molybdopterin cofactor-binding domain-containing protein [Bryobacteraceae bacterium]